MAWSAGALVLVAAAVTSIVAAQGPASPPPWPSSIAPIAAFVSKDRGLKFLHTVPVHFVAPKTFDKQIAEQDTGAQRVGESTRPSCRRPSTGRWG